MLVLCGLSLLFLGNLAYKEVFRKKSNIELFQNRSNAAIRKINRLIEFVQKIPEDLVYILEFQDVNKEEMQILLESVLFNNPEIFGSAIAYEPNQFIKDSVFYAPYVYRKGDANVFTNLNSPSYNYFQKDWYLIPKTLMKPVWSEPYFDTGGGNLLMSTYSIPFNKFNGSKEFFKGIVTVDVSIEELAKNVQTIGKLWGCHAMLISQNGTILSAAHPEWIFNETIFTMADKLKLPILHDIGKELQQGKSGLKKLDEFENQKDWYVFYSSIKTNKWGFLLFLPNSELYRH